jgi:hypothetical protein
VIDHRSPREGTCPVHANTRLRDADAVTRREHHSWSDQRARAHDDAAVAQR